MFTKVIPANSEKAKTRLIWLHGWGGSYEGMLALADYFMGDYENILVDLDGFGRAEEPCEPLSTADYAEKLIHYLNLLPKKENVICGFSYGGRVAVQMASRSDTVSGLVLLSAAGLPVKHTFCWKVQSFCKRNIKKMGRKYKMLSGLAKYVKGSDDYEKASDIMKKTLVMAVKEDLSNNAKTIKIPTVIITGEKDTATPPYIASQYHDFIEKSALHLLPNVTHLGVLTSPKATYFIEQFLNEKGFKS